MAGDELWSTAKDAGKLRRMSSLKGAGSAVMRQALAVKSFGDTSPSSKDVAEADVRYPLLSSPSKRVISVPTGAYSQSYGVWVVTERGWPPKNGIKCSLKSSD